MKTIDQLVSDAIWLCKRNNKVSPYLFQRALPTDYYTGEKIFYELVLMGLVINVKIKSEGDEDYPIGEVSKEKLIELSKN